MRRQAGRRVTLPFRRLVALTRAAAHARALAGTAVRDEGGVSRINMNSLAIANEPVGAYNAVAKDASGNPGVKLKT
jgi:hypothetical protein